MTGDDRIRDELESLERAVPTDPLPVAEAAPARPWRRIGLMGATVVAAIAVTSLAFGLGRSLDIGSQSSSPDPSEPSANPPAVAETRVGDFILIISSPKTVWTSEETIEVSAALTYAGEALDMTIGEGAPPIGFTIRSAGGQGAVVGTGHFRPCIQYPVSRDNPLIAALTKDGILVEEAIPVASPFGQTFSADPDLQLEPGEWEFTASTTFAERTCGDDYQLEVSITLQVVAPSSPSPPPSTDATPNPSDLGPSPTPQVRVCAAALAYGVLDADADGNPILIVDESLPPVAIDFSYPEDYVFEMPEGVFTVIKRGGNIVAQAGDEVELTGGFNADGSVFHACSIAPTEPDPRFDDDPSSVSGILVGDPQLEGGCIWLRDQSGRAWEILWPKEFEAVFVDGVAVLKNSGVVVASAGDRITAYGRRPTGVGSWCMVGIIYEAREVLIR
jgi:hypothetical protein